MRRTAIAAILLASASLLAQATTYRITHTYTLGGDGAWDYIVPDPPTHRLFVGRANRHARNTGLDLVTHKLFLVSAKFGPPPASGRGRGAVLPDTFTLMVVERGR